ncbi:STN domain-containing protein [Hymenobacter cellulosivorans]|uniref:STN domain-containing protein n=1 Tax=Hymenobacter cellulosivorans TaxID=2932249 RepID=A0ABY4FD38_9BACT|nr:STN domain-containing protein [Hymenobacter cellulosivorans]UOQ54595.1 STN domain-containing protein [Hymenobacter cellulosivorans]
MRYLFALMVGLWLLGSPAGAQPPLLARRVSVQATNAPLQQVLRDIAHQSGVSFSYSSTFIPLQKRVTLHMASPQPVSHVLQQLFQGQGVSYQVIGGQVVLWRTGERPPLGASKPSRPVTERTPSKAAATGQTGTGTSSKGSPRATLAEKDAKRPGPASYKSLAVRPTSSVTASTQRVAGPKPVALSTAPAKSVPPPVVAPPAPLTPAASSADTTAPATASVLARLRQKAKAAAQAATGALARTGRTVGTGAKAVLDTMVVATTELKEPLRKGARLLSASARRDSLTSRAIAVQSGLPGRDTVLDELPVKPTVARHTYDRHNWQVGFVTPLSSNWLRSGRSINRFSLNALAGYSAGVRGVELGGLANVVRDTVQGFQAAGLLNVTGTEVQGFQAAGLLNVTGGSVRGAQAAGLVNLVRDDARGLQLAGLVNIVGGAARSRQNDGRPARARRLLGLPRLLATDSAAQYLGAPSAMSLPGPLVQAAGLVNLTGTDIRGLQTAPILNSARRVQGLQLGLINVAKHVKGVQLGLINVADSVDGVALGLINIVRHGYLHGEVWASETLPLNAALKLGVRRYYTILSAAAQPFESRVHWATGFGIGTASRQHGRFSWNLDLLDWYLLKQPGTEGSLLSYTQLRPSLVWQIEPQGRLGLVVSPTLNLGLYENDGNGTNSKFGKNQLLILDANSGSTPVRLWLGGQIGLRF